MFTHPISVEDRILQTLADGYIAYKNSHWTLKISELGAAGYVINKCLYPGEIYYTYFEKISTTIGHGLFEEKQNAKLASLLFLELYYHSQPTS